MTDRSRTLDLSAIKGVLFDKDGTLIDFHATWIPAFCRAAEHVAGIAGRPDLADRLLAEAGYHRDSCALEADSMLASGTNRDISECWNAVLGAAAPRDMEKLILETFTRTSDTGLHATGDLERLFRHLEERGCVLGIATNDDEALAELAARRLGIRDRLAFLCGADSGFGGKPGPGMGLAFCRRTGLAPGEAAMVGDAAADAGMAAAAGFGASIGVLTGVATREELEPWFDVVVDSVSDLPELLTAGPAAPGP